MFYDSMPSTLSWYGLIDMPKSSDSINCVNVLLCKVMQCPVMLLITSNPDFLTKALPAFLLKSALELVYSTIVRTLLRPDHDMFLTITIA